MSGFSIVSIKKISLTLERLCLFGACRIPGLGYPSLVDGRAGGPHHALGRSHSAFSLMASFLVRPMTRKYGRWELATSSDICVLTRTSGRLRDDGKPTASALQGRSCHPVQDWAGQYVGDLPLSPQLIYFISLCSFCDLLGKQAEERRLIEHPFKNSTCFMLVLLHSCYRGL